MLFGLRLNALQRLRCISFRRPSLFLANARFHAKRRELVDVDHDQDQDREASKINNLLLDIHKQIPDFEDDHSPLLPLVHERITSVELEPGLRPTALDLVIQMLVENRCYTEAVSVYERMVSEGLPIPPPTNAGLAALSIVASGASRPNILKALSIPLADSHYTESSLLRLLDYLGKMAHPISFLLKVVRQFLQSRDANYAPSLALMTRLVTLQAKDAGLRGTLDWIARDGGDEDMKRSLPRAAGPYVALLEHIKTNGPGNTKAVDLVLAHMKSHNVTVTTGVFNALIGIQARRGVPSQAFSLYNVLVTLSNTQPVRPDSFTFAALFSILRTHSPGTRNARKRRFKKSKDTLSPRKLYRDLVFCHVTSRHRARPVITRSILNLALRTFLEHRDYAAAFVAARSFTTFHRRADRRTYYIVMKLLMDRIRYDMWRARDDEETRWGDHMLGISWQDVPSVQVDDRLARSVLAVGKSPPGTRFIRMPTLAQIDGDKPLKKAYLFEAIPLERILRKAVLADALLQDSSGTFTHSQLVSQAIRLAKQDMLPSQDIVRAKRRS